MIASKLKPLTQRDYDRAADRYYAALPMEHFMESVGQFTQRSVTVASLRIVEAQWPAFHLFGELLVQYRLKDGRIRKVVPDNMVVLNDEPLRAQGSFNVELEPARPFWMLEWVSPRSQGKDYNIAFRKYERDLRTPYCLMFYPEKKDLRMHRLVRRHYEPIVPDARGRYALPELDLELGLLGDWIRYWHKGRLLELPEELQTRADEEHARAENLQRRIESVEAENERLRALLAQHQIKNSS